MTNTQPLTDQQLDELEQLISRTTPVGAVTASPGLLAMLVAEVRRLRAVPSAPTQTALVEGPQTVTHNANQPAPVCKFEQGCHRVAACDPGCAVDLARMNAQLAAAEEAGPDDVLADAVALLREAATLYDAREQSQSAALLRRMAAELNTPSGLAAVPAAVEEQPDTNTPFVPPAADGLPLPALDSATSGAGALDVWARDPHGRNFLAHALVGLARDGWLRPEAGDGFEAVRDREPAEPQDPAAVAQPGKET